MGLIEGKERIHGIAIGRDRAILDHRPVRSFRGYDILRCSLKSWGARADGPEMVEERSPECRMEEIVGESEFAGVLPKLHLSGRRDTPSQSRRHWRRVQIYPSCRYRSGLAADTRGA